MSSQIQLYCSGLLTTPIVSFVAAVHWSHCTLPDQHQTAATYSEVGRLCISCVIWQLSQVFVKDRKKMLTDKILELSSLGGQKYSSK